MQAQILVEDPKMIVREAVCWGKLLDMTFCRKSTESLVHRSKQRCLNVKNIRIVLNVGWTILNIFPLNVFPPPNTHISGMYWSRFCIWFSFAHFCEHRTDFVDCPMQFVTFRYIIFTVLTSIFVFPLKSSFFIYARSIHIHSFAVLFIQKILERWIQSVENLLVFKIIKI